MAFKENMKEMKRTLKRFHPRYFLDRAHPLESIFLLAVGLVLIGLLIKILSFLVWVGGLVILVYIVSLIITFRENTR